MTSSNGPLRATVGQNSSSVQMAAANHVGAAVLVHADERSLRNWNIKLEKGGCFSIQVDK